MNKNLEQFIKTNSVVYDEQIMENGDSGFLCSLGLTTVQDKQSLMVLKNITSAGKTEDDARASAEVRLLEFIDYYNKFGGGKMSFDETPVMGKKSAIYTLEVKSWDNDGGLKKNIKLTGRADKMSEAINKVIVRMKNLMEVK